MSAAVSTALDVDRIKRDFPALERIVNGHVITYLDSAASSQKPWAVLQAMERYYETTHANVHRGVYATAVEATENITFPVGVPASVLTEAVNETACP